MTTPMMRSLTAQFLNAYLVSKGAAPANLDAFRTLMGSTATGVNTESDRTSAH